MDKSVLDAVHESAKELHKAGAIEQQTMRKFDALCLPPVKQMKGADIRRLREREGVSQPVFAAYLNTSKSTVSKWERDEKTPMGTTLKLLNIVEAKGLEVLAG